MTKKIIVISSLTIAIIALILIANFINGQNKVVSTITLDINPSIKIELNKNDKVLNISALNSDAKKIVNQSKGHKSLNDTLDILAENISKSKFVTEAELTILINTNGTINIDQVSQLVISSFRKNNVIPNLIVQNGTETSAKNAKKYGISEGKAAYIEKMIEEHDELTFDMVKDKTIDQLIAIRNSLVTEEEKEPEEEKQEDNENKEETKRIEPVQNNNYVVQEQPKKEEQQTQTETKVEEKQIPEETIPQPEETTKEITPVQVPEEDKTKSEEPKQEENKEQNKEQNEPQNSSENSGQTTENSNKDEQ